MDIINDNNNDNTIYNNNNNNDNNNDDNNDDLDLAQDVDKLSLYEFGNRLIKNYDILFNLQKPKWPSRLQHNGQIHYYSRILNL
jgi:hypothetical protein